MIDRPAFAPTTIRSPEGHARSFDETEHWLAPRLDRVPVTRVYDATPLDRVGLPVWAAVTPLARDLTVHAGKGETHEAARISAMMEAFERVSAEEVDEHRVRTASFIELLRERADQVVDPQLFDLPFQTTYRTDVPISWVEGYDVLDERIVWVPLDVVVSPPREGVCFGVETNGLAAGNNQLEAVVHAMYEVIERDAASHDRFARRFAGREADPGIRLVDIDSIPGVPGRWVSALSDRRLPATIQDLSHDVGVPVFRATISDRSFPGCEGSISRFEGLGCDLDAIRAVTRAICEAAQSHTSLFVGARDAFEGGRRCPVKSSGGLLRSLLSASSKEPFSYRPSDELATDLRDVLETLLERIADAGLRHCIVVDLTREDLGVPVVRVLIPGMVGPYGDTARRPGLRLLRALV